MCSYYECDRYIVTIAYRNSIPDSFSANTSSLRPLLFATNLHMIHAVKVISTKRQKE